MHTSGVENPTAQFEGGFACFHLCNFVLITRHHISSPRNFNYERSAVNLVTALDTSLQNHRFGVVLTNQYFENFVHLVREYSQIVS